MKKILIPAIALVFFSCGSSIDQDKASNYVEDVCTCYSEATNEAEKEKCEAKFQGFRKALDVDDSDKLGEKYVDQMMNCMPLE